MKDLDAIWLTVGIGDEGEVQFAAQSVIIAGNDRLHTLQRLVTILPQIDRGGRLNSIEFAPTEAASGIDLVIDEEGMYHSPTILNEPAMAYWREIGDLGCIDAGNLLNGHVVVLGATDDDGNATSAPAAAFARFKLRPLSQATK